MNRCIPRFFGDKTVPEKQILEPSPFDCLPDELLIHIFLNLRHPYYLMSLSLANRRFCQIVRNEESLLAPYIASKIISGSTQIKGFRKERKFQFAEKALIGKKMLKHLKFKKAKLTSRQIKLIHEHLPLIEKITINKGCLPLTNLKILPNLRHLIIDSILIGKNESQLFNKLTQLKKLTLRNNHLYFQAIHIFSLTQLTHLSLTQNGITLKGLPANLSHLTNLTYLNLSNNLIGDTGAKRIATLPALQSLNLNSNFVSKNGAKHLTRLTTLTRLRISEKWRL